MTPDDDMATSTARNGVKKGTNGAAKPIYRRTTPIVRVGKNFSKVQRVNSYAIERLSAWVAAGCEDKKILAILNMAMKVDEQVKEAVAMVAKLVDSNFQPPKKSIKIVFKSGDPVTIVNKYMAKYSVLYSDSILRHLTVLKILPSGEIAVQSSNVASTPFMVSKSHLELRS